MNRFNTPECKAAEEELARCRALMIAAKDREEDAAKDFREAHKSLADAQREADRGKPTATDIRGKEWVLSRKTKTSRFLCTLGNPYEVRFVRDSYSGNWAKYGTKDEWDQSPRITNEQMMLLTTPKGDE